MNFLVLVLISILFHNAFVEGQFCEDGISLHETVCLKQNYSKNSPPHLPMEVLFDFKVLDIPEVDEKSQSVTLTLFVDMHWKDDRIITRNITEMGTFLDDSVLEQVWMPELYITYLAS